MVFLYFHHFPIVQRLLVSRQEWGEMSSSLDDDSYRGSRDGVQVEKGGRSPRAAQIEARAPGSCSDWMVWWVICLPFQ